MYRRTLTCQPGMRRLGGPGPPEEAGITLQATIGTNENSPHKGFDYSPGFRSVNLMAFTVRAAHYVFLMWSRKGRLPSRRLPVRRSNPDYHGC